MVQFPEESEDIAAERDARALFSDEEIERLVEFAKKVAANPMYNHPQPLDDFNYELLF